MSPAPLDSAAAESLLAFWRDAGVDACFEDAPVDRTHVAPPPAVKAVAKATASVVAAPMAGDAIAEARRLAAGAATLEALGEAIGGLPEREQLVLSLYYEQELNLREIGAVLNVSESRVCQIHGQAMLRLRARLGEWRGSHDDEDEHGY